MGKKWLNEFRREGVKYCLAHNVSASHVTVQEAGSDCSFPQRQDLNPGPQDIEGRVCLPSVHGL